MFCCQTLSKALHEDSLRGQLHMQKLVLQYYRFVNKTTGVTCDLNIMNETIKCGKESTW